MTPDSKSRTVEEEQPPQPEWTPSGVPNCSEECRYHDGKRCGLMGLRAPAICEPTVEGMAAERIALRSEVERLRKALCFARHTIGYTAKAFRKEDDRMLALVPEELERTAKAIDAALASHSQTTEGK